MFGRSSKKGSIELTCRTSVRGGESNFVLTRTLEHENHRDQIFMRESRRRSDKSDLAKKPTPGDRKPLGPERPRPPQAVEPPKVNK